MNNSKVEKLAEEGDKKYIMLLKFIKEPSRFLATIQVGITLAGFLASASASQIFSNLIASWLINMGLPVSAPVAGAISVAIVVSLLTFFTLVLGELVPKRLALEKYESISLAVAKPLSILSRLTSPFIRLLTSSTNSLIRLFGGNPEAHEERISEEEIRIMVDVGEEKGVIREIEKEMIENIFEFNDTPVSKVMTRRMDIVAISADAGLEEVLHAVNDERFSRIPVYEDTIDNIVGILNVKDIISLLINKGRNSFKLKEIIRTPYFVPESKKTDALFKELKHRKIHIAVVIDEFGGTAGIVTMEDLIEEIMGNIFDEDDEVIKEIDKIDESTFIADGALRLDEMADFFDIKMPVEDYETLSGFLIGQLGRIPEEGEKAVIEYEGLVFKIENIENKTISKVKICKA